MGFDESRCSYDVLGAIGEEVVEEVLRAHLEEQFFLPELVLKGIVDEMVGDEFDGDVLGVEGGDLALAHGDEGGQVALEDAVLEVELGVVLSDVVGVLAHLDGVEDAEVLDLVVADLVHEGEALLHLVGLYAADEVQVGVVGHLADEVSHLLADLDPEEPLVALHLEALPPLLEALRDYLQLRLAQLLHDVLPDQVLVLLSEALRHVLDVPWRVPDDEGPAQVDVVGGGELVMLLVMLADVGEEVIVLDVEGAALVQQVEDALVEGVQQLDDLAVVGEVELGDYVLQPLLPQHVLLVDEHLLEVDLVDPLVCVVHAELLEAVVLEHLEAVDVQELYGPRLLLHLVARVELPVQLLDQPLEQALVNCLRHRIPPLSALPVTERTQDQFPRDSPAVGD